MEIKITWAQMRDRLGLKYIQTQGNFYIYAATDEIRYICVIDENSSDAADFITNHKDSSTSLV